MKEKDVRKIDTKKFPFPDDKRLKNVKFIVFGNSFRFWEQCHNDVQIDSDNMGTTFVYHAFSKSQPCYGLASFAKVNGVYTMFVEASGAYANWFKFETYVFAMCGLEMNPDNHTNDDNFHNHVAMLNRTKEQRIQSCWNEIAEKKRDLDRLNKLVQEMEPKKHLYWIKNHPTDHNLCPLCEAPLKGCHIGDYCSNDGCGYVDGVCWLTEEQVKKFGNKVDISYAQSVKQINS